jgi:hypothetical protein
VYNPSTYQLSVAMKTDNRKPLTTNTF